MRIPEDRIALQFHLVSIRIDDGNMSAPRGVQLNIPQEQC